MDELRNALDDYKTTKIPGKKVNGVFLTGGASRMNFIRPIIAEAFNLPLEKVKIDNDNPSLTISRGIALLGATDATTTILVAELKKSLPSLFNSNDMMNKLREKLSENITNEAWNVVDSACSYWVKSGKGTDESELKGIVQNRLKTFQTSQVPTIINKTLEEFLSQFSEDIRKKMNEIISRYAPGREISSSSKLSIGNIQAINDSLSNMSKTISDICDSISNVLGDILWAALGVFLWGVLCAPYYLYKIFRSDESKRKDKADKVRDKRFEVTWQVQSKINSELSNNTQFKNSVSSSLNNYFTKLIDTNLAQVIIPIE